MAERHGTEISFRLGPGTLDEARAIAARLALAAAGCRRHVLFVDAERGEYGCLAEWDAAADAREFSTSPAVARELERIGVAAERPVRVRRYIMEEQVPG